MSARCGRVLGKALREFRDGRGPDTDEHLGRIVRVALKIAAEFASLLRHSQAIGLGGEMIDPDFGITIPQKQAARGLEQVKPLLWCGQRVRGDHLLALGHPRHMRVAIERHTVRVEREQFLHAFCNPRL